MLENSPVCKSQKTLNQFGFLGFQEELNSSRKTVSLPALLNGLFHPHGSGKEKQFISFCFCSGLCSGTTWVVVGLDSKALHRLLCGILSRQQEVLFAGGGGDLRNPA